uniref:Uncharacterized protein n=1 Tax=Amphiprion percula TaxID=161767 RepID=A0A3P8SJ71_AMPPE
MGIKTTQDENNIFKIKSVCLALSSSEKWMGKCFRLGTGVINGNQRFCDSSDSVKDVNIYRQHPKKPTKIGLINTESTFFCQMRKR